jgi:hypothetical protein
MKLFELDNYDELLIGSGKGIIQVDNKTRQYIFPALLFHGRTYQNAMLSYSFVAAGIRDDEKPELFNPNRIGLLFNVQKSINTDFKNLGHGYVADYYFGELMYGHLHMVVMELPKFCQDVTIKAFLNSEYSKMYRDPSTVFNNTNSKSEYYLSTKQKCLAVCLKTEERRLELEAKLAGDLVTPTLDENAELDDKIILEEEIFNYGK